MLRRGARQKDSMRMTIKRHTRDRLPFYLRSTTWRRPFSSASLFTALPDSSRQDNPWGGARGFSGVPPEVLTPETCTE